MQVTVEEARLLLDAPDAPQLVDCRQPEEWSIVRIAGATLAPLPELLDHVEGLDPARPVLVYCHHGIRSINAAVLLERHGFTAMSMRGGIDAWSLRIDPSLPRYG